MPKRNVVYFLFLALVAVACTVKAVGDPNKPITINAHIVVDIREMKQTASSIEDMIAQGAQPATVSSTPAAQKLAWAGVLKKVWEPRSAYAEGGYDLKEITPVIQGALDGRKARYQKLVTLKTANKIGEDNGGLVKDLSGEASVSDVVKAENRDRMVIYEAIVKQNSLPASAIHTVRSVFAEVQRNNAKPGEKVQMSNGSWETKS